LPVYEDGLGISSFVKQLGVIVKTLVCKLTSLVKSLEMLAFPGFPSPSTPSSDSLTTDELLEFYKYDYRYKHWK
jgi:hypothetical protein